MAAFLSWCWDNYLIIAAVWGVVSAIKEMLRRTAHGQIMDGPLVFGCLFGGLIFGLLWPIFLPLQIVGITLLLAATALGSRPNARGGQ